MSMDVLYDEMKLLSDVSFREIYRKLIYVNCPDILKMMFPGEISDDITGIFAYCYIDGQEGLSLRPAMLASMKADSMRTFTFPHQEDTLYILRLREGDGKMNEIHDGDRHMYLYAVDPAKHYYIDLSVLNVDMNDFSDFMDMIDENYDPDEMVEELRSEKFSFLDKYRHPSFPDDVEVILYSEEIGGEQVWVRLSVLTQNDEILGILLNEPYNDYGCHEGSLIEIEESKGSDDSFLYFTGRIARRNLS